MAITLGSKVNISVFMNNFSDTMINSWDYTVDGSAFLVEPVQIAEAWWNHVKTAYRGIFSSTYGAIFRTIKITELNNDAGDYAEFNVPLAEQTGTRSTGSTEAMPPFNAVGVRLTVGSRVTRPGQKRFGLLYEADQNGGNLTAGILTPVNTLMAVMTESMILGAPAATIVLNPIVARRDRATGFVTADQPIQGWLTNNRVTTQNTRKIGRGM